MGMIAKATAACVAFVLSAGPAFAQKKYDPGASDTEIKLGQTMPYSGPLSGFITLAKAELAYFDMVNAQGGVNGRRIRLLSVDDGYSPPKTVELIRQLVEQEKVLCTHNTLGTATNTAIHKYMNQKKVPHLYLATGASKWGDYQHFPWTMGYQPDYHTEGAIYAKHILATVKEPRIGVLMQNDDYGKDYWDGFREGLGKDAARLVVKHVTYEITEPTVDSQIIQLKAADANVFFNIATPKFAAQAMRKIADLGWKPVQYVNNVSASVGTVMKPAGFDNVQGVLTASYVMDPTDPTWEKHEDMAAFKAFMAKYHPTAHVADLGNVSGYTVSFLMTETLRRCGDTLTRANIMKQATSFQKFRVPMLLPGITVSTGPTDYYPIQAVQLQRFKGQTWQLFGDILSAESA